MLQHFRKQRGQKGFTLIELLVVIAIIGILATIVLVSLNTARQKARDTRRISDIRQVALALEMYYDDNSAYPGTSGTDQWGVMETAIEAGGNYMSSVPIDPSAGGVYLYRVDATGQDYILGATLENTENAALATDSPDAFGQVCTDPIYCYSP